MKNLAKTAYDAHCESRGWRSVKGDILPQFEEQSEYLKKAWRDAAYAVIDDFSRCEDTEEASDALIALIDGGGKCEDKSKTKGIGDES